MTQTPLGLQVSRGSAQPMLSTALQVWLGSSGPTQIWLMQTSGALQSAVTSQAPPLAPSPTQAAGSGAGSSAPGPGPPGSGGSPPRSSPAGSSEPPAASPLARQPTRDTRRRSAQDA